MENVQAERIAGQLLSILRTGSEIKLLLRSAKKGHYCILFTTQLYYGFWGSDPNGVFQVQYNQARSELVKRLQSMEIIQGEKSPHIRRVA
jgi:hypothetical protein